MCSAGARSVGRTFPGAFVLGWVLILGSTAPAETPDTFAPITVYVFNAADVSLHDLAKAETLAAGIFEKAGIDVTWVAGSTSPRADDSPVIEKWNRANLLIRVWTSSKVRGKGISSEKIGFCLSMDKNEAVVLFDAIRNRALQLRVEPAIPLGVSIAHEMGHLLLQSPTHSLAGVMKSRWLAEDLTAAEGGTMRFTSEESHSIRTAVRNRFYPKARRWAADGVQD